MIVRYWSESRIDAVGICARVLKQEDHSLLQIVGERCWLKMISCLEAWLDNSLEPISVPVDIDSLDGAAAENWVWVSLQKAAGRFIVCHQRCPVFLLAPRFSLRFTRKKRVKTQNSTAK